MIKQTLTIYKGDILSGLFYLGFAATMLILSLVLFQVTTAIGYTYLALGLLLFCVYSAFKGILIIHVSRSRKRYFQSMEALSTSAAEEELQYTDYRIRKKEENRRRFIWGIGIGILISILGMVMNEKGLVIGTVIPIVLFSAVEFCVGLLTEFRLWQYHRKLEKFIVDPSSQI